eukprot:COSAG04_NODE_29828_length_266_cov_0.898204_1_plen_64_part_01
MDDGNCEISEKRSVRPSSPISSTRQGPCAYARQLAGAVRCTAQHLVIFARSIEVEVEVEVEVAV